MIAKKIDIQFPKAFGITTTPKLFIGHDIHKLSWRLQFTTDLTIGSSRTMPPDSEGLYDYVQKYYPDHEVSIAYKQGAADIIQPEILLSLVGIPTL